MESDGNYHGGEGKGGGGHETGDEMRVRLVITHDESEGV